MVEVLDKNKFEVDDVTVYDEIIPVWNILEDVPPSSDIRFSLDELWEKTGVDPETGNNLLLRLEREFVNKLVNNITSVLFSKKQLVDTWLFDRHMLISLHVDLNGRSIIPDNPVLKKGLDNFKYLWLKRKAEEQGV